MHPEGIPKQLRLARAMIELSRSQVAREIGVHDNTLAAWETGKNDIPLRKAMELCELYGITLAFLTGETEDMTSIERLNEISDRLKRLEEASARRSGRQGS